MDLLKLFYYYIQMMLVNFNNRPQHPTECMVPVTSLQRKQPLIINEEGKYWTPSSAFLSDGLIFTCDPGNQIEPLDDDGGVLGCSGDELFYGETSVNVNSLVCDYLITADIITTRVPCANGKGNISRIGFTTGFAENRVELFEVCYSQVTADAIYSKHILRGESLRYKQSNYVVPEFKSVGTARHVSPQYAFNKTTQSATFKELFKLSGINYFYYDLDSFLAVGQLVPDADFPLIPLQLATYFYVNAAPIWQAVSNNNWRTVENAVRETASDLQTDFEIYTGVHGVLELPDFIEDHQVPQRFVEVYLVPERKSLAVPEYLWKVVYRRSTGEGIAFVTVNNPYAYRHQNLLCRNMCGYRSEFQFIEEGLTYCCHVDELRQMIPNIPPLNIRSLLNIRL